jgi:hypothetical protein
MSLTGADKVHIHISGADVAGGSQRNPNASLGGFRSSIREEPLGWIRSDLHRGLRMDFAAGENGAGLGELRADTSDSIRWRPPGGSEGASVSIALGETKVIEGVDTDKYIVVTRTASTALAGTETIQMILKVNNVVGGSNFTGDEEAAGEIKYRSLHITSEAADVASFDVWLDDDTDNIRLSDGGESSTLDLELEAIANEYTEPAGQSWQTPTEGSPLNLWTGKSAAIEAGLWIEKTVVADSGYDSSALVILHYKFNDGTEHTGTLTGIYRTAENGLKKYLLWVSQNVDPDTSLAPDYESDTSPIVTSALAADNDYHCTMHEQNEYGVQTLINEVIIKSIDSAGDEQELPPSAPENDALTPLSDGVIRIESFYNPLREGQSTADINSKRADAWLIYEGVDGAAPNPSVDTPVEVAMNDTDLNYREILQYDSVVEHLENAPVEVLIRTRRSGTPDSDSTNTTTVSTTAEWFGPENPPGQIAIGSKESEAQEDGLFGSPIITIIDAVNNIYWEQIEGETRLWADTVLVWNLIYDSQAGTRELLCTPFSFDSNTVTGSGTDPIEVGQWDGGGKFLYINVNGTRVCEIDVLNEVITVAAYDAVQTLNGSLSDSPIWEMWEETVLQVWDIFAERHVTAVSFGIDGTMTSIVGLSVEANQAACLP